MDRKKLETKLKEWSSDFGFTLPNGLPPPENFFSALTATPNRSYLWETILEKLEPRGKVESVRKQIFLSRLRAKSRKGNVYSKDYFLQAAQEAGGDKLELWKEKETLEKGIKEKRMAIENLESEIENLAMSIQSDICKMAKVKKHSLECKEKAMILKLSLKKYEEQLEKHSTFLDRMKECRSVYELGGHGNKQDDLKNLATQINKQMHCSCKGNQPCDLQRYVHEICQNEIPENVAWETVLTHKKKILEDFDKSVIEKSTLESHLNEEKSRLATLKSTEEKIKLDITEKSLQVILNKLEEQSLDLKNRQLFKDLLSTDEDSDPSNSHSLLFSPNESREIERKEILKLEEGLNYIGLKKRMEFLKSELVRLNEDCERKKIFLEEKEEADKKLLESRNKLANLTEELESLKSRMELSEEDVKVEYSILKSAINEVEVKVSDSGYVANINKNVEGLENSAEKYVKVFSETNLDAFRRIQGPSGKQMLECESLSSCLNNYGGELKDLFSSLLISPYKTVDFIITSMENRKKFHDVISRSIPNDENLIEERRRALYDVPSDFDYGAVDKYNKETKRNLIHALNRLENVPESMEATDKILNAWHEQPFRHMIPVTIKHNESTYRDYESHYKKSLNALKYFQTAGKRK